MELRMGSKREQFSSQRKKRQYGIGRETTVMHIVNADKTTTTQTHLILILSIVIIIIENHNVLRAEGVEETGVKILPVAAMQVQNAGSGLIRLRKLIIRKTVAVGIAGSHHAVKVLPQIGGEGKSTDEMAESYAASRVRPKHHAGWIIHVEPTIHAWLTRQVHSTDSHHRASPESLRAKARGHSTPRCRS